MRKYFEGHSTIGVAIIFSVFLLALVLRFYDLGSQGPWSDELASWWYLRHLDEVWGRESHSPLYYLLLRIFVGTEGDIKPLRVFSAVISAIHLIECFFLGQKVFDKKRFLIFWILICLNPVDIVYARMARHYAWLLEGILVFYLLLRSRATTWVLSLVAAFMGFIHVFAVIPVCFFALYRYWGERDKKFLVSLLASANAIVMYYLLRIVFLGHENVRRNVSWNELDPFTFWSSVVTQFLGESYPRIEYYHVNVTFAAIVLGLSCAFIAYRKKESGVLFLALFIASILIIESLTFWINLRTNRYIIYLVGLWIVALVDSFDEVKDAGVYVTLLAAGLYISWFNPLLTYPWDEEKLASWDTFQKTHDVPQKLVCANPYLTDYYKLGPSVNCLESIGTVDRSRPLLYFDLSGIHAPVTAALSNEMQVEEYVPLKRGLIVKFVPRKKDER